MQIIRENQRVNQLLLDETINLTPPNPTSYFTDNFLQRTLARLFGLTSSNKLVQLAATEAGALLVSDTGAGYGNVEEIQEYTSDNAVQYDFAQVVSMPDIYINTYAAKIWISPDGASFTGPVTIDANIMWNPPVSIKSIKIQALVAGYHGQVTAIGYY